jgi:hypothetical protein
MLYVPTGLRENVAELKDKAPVVAVASVSPLTKPEMVPVKTVLLEP